jgi:hypothetical protein
MAVDLNKPGRQEDLDYKDFVYQVKSAWMDEHPRGEVSLEDYLLRALWHAERTLEFVVQNAQDTFNENVGEF